MLRKRSGACKRISGRFEWGCRRTSERISIAGVGGIIRFTGTSITFILKIVVGLLLALCIANTGPNIHWSATNQWWLWLFSISANSFNWVIFKTSKAINFCHFSLKLWCGYMLIAIYYDIFLLARKYLGFRSIFATFDENIIDFRNLMTENWLVLFIWRNFKLFLLNVECSSRLAYALSKAFNLIYFGVFICDDFDWVYAFRSFVNIMTLLNVYIYYLFISVYSCRRRWSDDWSKAGWC